MTIAGAGIAGAVEVDFDGIPADFVVNSDLVDHGCSACGKRGNGGCDSHHGRRYQRR